MGSCRESVVWGFCASGGHLRQYPETIKELDSLNTDLLHQSAAIRVGSFAL